MVEERKTEEIKMHDLTTSAHQTFYRHERPSLANLSTTTVLQQSLELKCRFQARLEARMLPSPSIHYVFLPSLITKKRMQALASVHHTSPKHNQRFPCTTIVLPPPLDLKFPFQFRDEDRNPSPSLTMPRTPTAPLLVTKKIKA